MLPGRITAYDAAKQRASVQVLIQEAHTSELEERVAQTVPEIHEVPLWFFGAQATGRITVPVAIGDVGMVMFASSSIARWKFRGGLVDPGDDTKHGLNDCVFVPGLHDFAHVPTTAPTDAIVTHGPTKIGGPTGTERTIMADTFVPALSDVLTEIIAALNVIAPASGATAAGKLADMLAAAIKTTLARVK